MNIAIIPARGGSKRIPRKNIREFHGKPLIAYSIETALNSDCFDRVIVSTDDIEIAEIAEKFGAEVPFVRPKDISDDYATTVDVIQHAIRFVMEEGESVDNVCCIYATAPFLLSDYLKQGLDVLIKEGAKYTFGATSFPFPIQRAIRLNKNNRVSMFDEKNMNVRSQDLEEAFHDAGQFYWGTASAYLEGSVFFADHSVAIQIPRKRVQDIDTLEDWELAESLYAALKK